MNRPDALRRETRLPRWLAVLLCALLWVAPCAAADGRWFLDNLSVRAPLTGEVAPSPEIENRNVVLAPGVVSRRPFGSNPVLASTSHPSLAAAVWPPLPDPRPVSRAELPRLVRAVDGRDTHLLYCLLLI